MEDNVAVEAEPVETETGTDVPDPVKKHIERVVNSPVEMLLLKLEQWLLQQPEWAVILAAPRATRRSAIQLLSKRLLTIPQRYRGI